MHLEGASFPGEILKVGSAKDIENPVDVAVVAVPSSAGPEVLANLEGRAAHAIVYTSGFAEAGAKGLATFHGETLGILGPNTVGLYYAPSRTVLTFAAAFDDMLDCPTGSGAFMISHSGAFGVRIARAAARRGLPLDGFVATGNEDGYRATDVMHAILQSETLRPRVVLLYLESVRDGFALAHELESARHHGVRVVLLAGGRSQVGLEAATSHTAAVSADHHVIAEICRMNGAVVVNSDRALIDAAIGLTCNPPSRGMRAAVVTGSGGAGVVAADLLSDAGVGVARLSDETRGTLVELLPPYASVMNPVDVTAQVIGDGDMVAKVARVLAGSAEIDVLLVVGRAEQAATIARALEGTGCALVVATLDGDASTTAPLVRGGVALTPDLESACRAVASLASSARADTLATIEVRPPILSAPRPNLDAIESVRLVERAGVRCAPFRLAASVLEAQTAADEVGWPVVLKSNVGAATHKAKSGGVRLDLTASTIEVAARELLQHSESVIVASQLRGGLELFASVRRDRAFGLVIVAGLGGGFVETLDRVVSFPVFASVPWIESRLKEDVFGDSDEGKRWATLLANNVRKLADLAGSLGASLVECNPLIEYEGELVALDARILMEGKDTND
jgi:acyl-CoA synthetase (NDP forming)